MVGYDDGTYHRKTCSWCEGIGATTSARVDMFQRWSQILRHNQAKGLCPARPKRPTP